MAELVASLQSLGHCQAKPKIHCAVTLAMQSDTTSSSASARPSVASVRVRSSMSTDRGHGFAFSDAISKLVNKKRPRFL